MFYVHETPILYNGLFYVRRPYLSYVYSIPHVKKNLAIRRKQSVVGPFMYIDFQPSVGYC